MIDFMMFDEYTPSHTSHDKPSLELPAVALGSCMLYHYQCQKPKNGLEDVLDPMELNCLAAFATSVVEARLKLKLLNNAERWKADQKAGPGPPRWGEW